MTCKQCKEVYAEQFHEDFVKGICLPCQSQNDHDKWWAAIQKELTVYNATFNTDHDFNSFCYDSSINKIKSKSLNAYSELRKVCKREHEWREEYLTSNVQPELPF
jgi:hypothetical protein